MSANTFGADDPQNVEQFRLGTGAANAYPRVGPVVISEIMYNPLVGDAYEFIELRNVTFLTPFVVRAGHERDLRVHLRGLNTPTASFPCSRRIRSNVARIPF